MPEGFELYDANGVLQLDTLSPTLTFAYKGTATVGIAIEYSAKGSINIITPPSVKVPVIAIRSLYPICPYYTQSYNGGYSHWYHIDAYSGQVDYYVFDSISDSFYVPVQYGMELYDANSKLTYSTGRGVAKTFGVLHLGGSVTLQANRQFAVVITSFSGYRHLDGGPVDDGGEPLPDSGNGGNYPQYHQSAFCYGAAIRNNAAITGAIDFLSGPVFTPAPDFDIPFKTCLVLDVTEYGGGAVPGNGVGAVTMSLNPTSQSLSGARTSQTFVETAVPVGGTATSFTWSLNNIVGGGSWSIISGQGTGSVTVQVTNVPNTDTSSAVLGCVATINGSGPVSASANLAFGNTLGTQTVATAISPTRQDLSGSVALRTFGTFTASATVGGVATTPTSFTWKLSDTSGQWSIASGQGTSQCTPRVSGVASGDFVNTEFWCTVVVNGQSYDTPTAILTYQRSGTAQ